MEIVVKLPIYVVKIKMILANMLFIDVLCFSSITKHPSNPNRAKKNISNLDMLLTIN